MGNHGANALKSRSSLIRRRSRACSSGPQYAAATDWMSRLPYYYETPDCIVVHAALMPGVALSEQREEDPVRQHFR